MFNCNQSPFFLKPSHNFIWQGKAVLQKFIQIFLRIYFHPIPLINCCAQLFGIRYQHNFDVFDIKDMFDDFQHIDGVIEAAAVEFVDKQNNRFFLCKFF